MLKRYYKFIIYSRTRFSCTLYGLIFLNLASGDMTSKSDSATFVEIPAELFVWSAGYATWSIIRGSAK